MTLSCFFSLLGGQVTSFVLSVLEVSPVNPILTDKADPNNRGHIPMRYN